MATKTPPRKVSINVADHSSPRAVSSPGSSKSGTRTGASPPTGKAALMGKLFIRTTSTASDAPEEEPTKKELETAASVAGLLAGIAAQSREAADAKKVVPVGGLYRGQYFADAVAVLEKHPPGKRTPAQLGRLATIIDDIRELQGVPKKILQHLGSIRLRNREVLFQQDQVADKYFIILRGQLGVYRDIPAHCLRVGSTKNIFLKALNKERRKQSMSPAGDGASADTEDPLDLSTSWGSTSHDDFGDDRPERKARMAVLQEGIPFGATGLADGGKRGVTVRALTTVDLAVLTKKQFLQISGYLKKTTQEQVLEQLQLLPAMDSVPPGVQEAMSYLAVERRLREGEVVASDDDSAQARELCPLHVVLRGSVRACVTGTHHELMMLRPGEPVRLTVLRGHLPDEPRCTYVAGPHGCSVFELSIESMKKFAMSTLVRLYDFSKARGEFLRGRMAHLKESGPPLSKQGHASAVKPQVEDLVEGLWTGSFEAGLQPAVLAGIPGDRRIVPRALPAAALMRSQIPHGAAQFMVSSGLAVHTGRNNLNWHGLGDSIQKRILDTEEDAPVEEPEPEAPVEERRVIVYEHPEKVYDSERLAADSARRERTAMEARAVDRYAEALQTEARIVTLEEVRQSDRGVEGWAECPKQTTPRASGSGGSWHPGSTPAIRGVSPGLLQLRQHRDPGSAVTNVMRRRRSSLQDVLERKPPNFGSREGVLATVDLSRPATASTSCGTSRPPTRGGRGEIRGLGECAPAAADAGALLGTGSEFGSRAMLGQFDRDGAPDADSPMEEVVYHASAGGAGSPSSATAPGPDAQHLPLDAGQSPREEIVNLAPAQVHRSQQLPRVRSPDGQRDSRQSSPAPVLSEWVTSNVKELVQMQLMPALPATTLPLQVRGEDALTGMARQEGLNRLTASVQALEKLDLSERPPEYFWIDGATAVNKRTGAVLCIDNGRARKARGVSASQQRSTTEKTLNARSQSDTNLTINALRQSRVATPRQASVRAESPALTTEAVGEPSQLHELAGFLPEADMPFTFGTLMTSARKKPPAATHIYNVGIDLRTTRPRSASRTRKGGDKATGADGHPAAAGMGDKRTTSRALRRKNPGLTQAVGGSNPRGVSQAEQTTIEIAQDLLEQTEVKAKAPPPTWDRPDANRGAALRALDVCRDVRPRSAPQVPTSAPKHIEARLATNLSGGAKRRVDRQIGRDKLMGPSRWSGAARCCEGAPVHEAIAAMRAVGA
mmetsp:Transcript_44983/g.118845  ORF Transcript_44983/g.118845 Transcript_44983/m.118845 type:complete len:1234 (+) Transcript_44983:35-3736(+)